MIERMIGAAKLDVNTYEEVEADKGATGQALLVVLLVTVASFVGTLLLGEDVDVVRALIVGIIRGVVGWAVWALFTMLIGTTLLKTEQTQADWGELARTTGFAQTPGIFYVLVFIPAVGAVIALVAFIWSIVAMVIGVRQALDYTSTWRAFFVVLLAAIPSLVLTGVVVALTGGVDGTS